MKIAFLIIWLFSNIHVVLSLYLPRSGLRLSHVRSHSSPSRLYFSDNDSNEQSPDTLSSSGEKDDEDNNPGTQRKGGKSSRRQKYRGEYSKEEFQAVLNKELEDFQRTSQKSSFSNGLSSSNSPSSSFTDPSSATRSSGDGGPVKMIKDLISLVLIADFFVVILFLGWFVAAALLKDTNPFLLERFQDIFNPIVVPCLTVLMVGSIASGVLGDGKDKK